MDQREFRERRRSVCIGSRTNLSSGSLIEVILDRLCSRIFLSRLLRPLSHEVRFSPACSQSWELKVVRWSVCCLSSGGCGFSTVKLCQHHPPSHYEVLWARAADSLSSKLLFPEASKILLLILRFNTAVEEQRCSSACLSAALCSCTPSRHETLHGGHLAAVELLLQFEKWWFASAHHLSAHHSLRAVVCVWYFGSVTQEFTSFS